ncbi:MAG TPA: hypothetical protein VFW28_18665 [Micropepsaceae bacterium]|nr:hypothetical protein [Micropepsaceae bacterium]
MAVSAPIDTVAVDILIDEFMEPEPVNFVVSNASNGMPQDALRRCATGEITPELALTQLLSRGPAPHEIEAALGAAIWDALESRESIRVNRLADLQNLWNRRRVHSDLQSV